MAASTTAVARAVLLIGVILSQVIGPSPLTTQAADALTTATGPPTYVYDSPSASTTHTSNARIDPARERGATAGHMWSSTFLISRGHATKGGRGGIADLVHTVAGPRSPKELKPPGMTTNEWGGKIWGQRAEGARAAIGARNAQELRTLGLTEDTAQELSVFYRLAANRGQGGAAAGARADLMKHIAEVLRGG